MDDPTRSPVACCKLQGKKGRGEQGRSVSSSPTCVHANSLLVVLLLLLPRVDESCGRVSGL